jgi:superfamily II DNA helicase RecQ
VQADIVACLGMREPIVRVASALDRPNLAYVVDHIAGDANDTACVVDWVRRLSPRGDECGIVYCWRRRDCDSVCEALVAGGGATAHVYHAELSDAARADVLRAWRAGHVRVVVATLAFGMGIDKPDVRFVVHHVMSRSIAAYYQESGRAGRDGQRSTAVLLVADGDAERLATPIEAEARAAGHSTAALVKRERALGALQRMAEYAYAPLTSCRRASLLELLGASAHACRAGDVPCDACARREP